MKTRFWFIAVSLLLAVVVIAGCQSPAPVAPSRITFSAPSSGAPGTAHTFVVTTEPVTATQPLKFTWEATGQAPIVSSGTVSNTASFTWSTSGPQLITVTAENSAGKVTQSFDFAVEQPLSQEPLEAVQTIADKQKDVKSQHINLTMALQLKLEGLTGEAAQSAAMFKNFKANANMSGDVDTAKEDFALKGDLDLGPLTALLAQGEEKISFEAVKVGEKIYTKTNVGDTANQWNTTDAPKATTEMTETNPLSPEMVMSLLKQSSKAEKLADEKIGDTDTYHYKVTMDPEALITALAELTKSTGGSVDQAEINQAKQILKDATLDIELWAGKSDLLLRQVKAHFNLNLKNVPDQPGASALIDFVLTDTVSQVNQPVTITAPK